MKLELPCEIVRDLLPNYVDGLTSDSSTDSVEAHLKQCKHCNEVYETMKKDYQTPSNRAQEVTAESKQEKNLFRKINKTMNQNVRKAIYAGCIGIVFVAVLFYGLFNVAIKEVPIEEVQISASVYDVNDMIDLEGEEVTAGSYPSQEMSVVISKGEMIEPDQLVTLTIPDNVKITLTNAVIEESPYISVITLYSPYHLRNIDLEYRTVNDQTILYISSIRTTLLGNQANGMNNGSTTLEFQKIDKIIYVDKEGHETTMWCSPSIA